MYMMISGLIIGILCLGILFAAGALVTRKRLNVNQKEWDDYSKDMSFDEKLDCYVDFCTNQKNKYGWEYYYFPKIDGAKQEGICQK